MRILLIHNYYYYRGGEDIYVDSLIDLLKKKGSSVYLYSKKNEVSISFIKKVKIYLGLFRNTSIDQEIHEIIDRFNPDVIHIHNPFYLISFHIISVIKRYNIPIVITVQNYRLLCPGGYLYNNGKRCIHNTQGNHIRKLFSSCYQHSFFLSFSLLLYLSYLRNSRTLDLFTKFIFVSNTVRTRYSSFLHLSQKKMTVLYNFSQSNSLKREPKRGKEYFLFVGRFSEEKGISDLLKIAQKNKEIRFIFIGNGPLSKIVEKDKYDNIIFLNFLKREEVLLYMEKAIAVITPSKWTEACPLVVIESFSAGTPVIAPKYGAFTEFIKNGKNGFFYRFNDTHSLEQVIQKVWKSKEKIKGLSKYCLDTYKRNYTEEIHYEKLMGIYKSVI